METMQPRDYQQELIDMANGGNNVLVSLDTGSGKTLIAAKVIHAHLENMRATQRIAVFLAPTNPLVAQQHMVMNAFGLRCKAYHGNEGTNGLSSWDKAKWTAEWRELDLLVMTPEVLLHILAHGYMSLADVGLLVFDECHHCHYNHPYNQIMEDFYQRLPAQRRPQILALTASPDGMVPSKKKSKAGGDPGLEANLSSHLLTAQNRDDVAEVVHLPSILTKEYQLAMLDDETSGAVARLACSLDLMSSAAKCEKLSELLRKGQQLAQGLQEDAASSELEGLGPPDSGGSGFEAGRLEKQIRAIKTCLEQLGPWAAAAAAYLDLLAPSNAAMAPIPEHADGMVGMELAQLLAQRIEDDDVGDATTEAELKGYRSALLGHLQARTVNQPGQPALLRQDDLTKAAASQNTPAKGSPPTDALVEMAVRLALIETISALANLLMRDDECRQQLVAAFHAEAKKDLQQRGDGLWQPFAAVLMQQVPWQALQAQALPGSNAGGSNAAGISDSWGGPALVTPKVVAMLESLWQSLPQAGPDGWAAMVFVETRLSALVLSRLINSLPDIRGALRASEFVGTTMMDQKAQRRVMEDFRSQKLNVLVATNVGSEGMDFRQCCLVLAVDEPQTVTQFIQCRGRARAAGSMYRLLALPGFSKKCSELESKTKELQEEAEKLSRHNRSRMQMQSGQLANGASSSRTGLCFSDQSVEPLTTTAGACVTMRLAQPLLAEFCAKLPGTEGYTLLQPHYYTRRAGDYLSTVYLPSNSGLTTPIHGSYQQSRSLARQAAALEALKQLYKAGQLNEHLQPTWGSPHMTQQIKCQPVAKFAAKRTLPSVLQPRVLPAHAGASAAGPAGTVTMQLHTFRVHMPQQQQLWQQQVPGSSAAATAMLHESAPLQASSSISSAAISSSMAFGVLLPERLPDNLPAFGAWMPGCEGQQCMVTVQHAGTVELQPTQLSVLAAYQQVLEKHITLPNVLRRRKRKASSRPFTASHCVSEFGFAFCKLQLALGWQQLGKQQQQESGSAFAYHIVPLTSSSSSNGAVFDWGAVQAMAAGPVPALQLVQTANNSSASTSSIRPAVTVYQATAAAVATASTPRASAHMAAAGTELVGPAAVHAAAAQLQDRVLISQHSYEPWHCTGISSIACGQPTNWLPQGMSHQQLYETKHGYTGLSSGLPQLRQDLPLLEAHDGRGFKGKTCLKRVSEPGATHTAAPQAAAVAAAPEAAADAGSSQHVGKQAHLHAPSAAGSASQALVQQHDNMHHQQHVHQLDSPAANAAEGAKQGPCLPLEVCWVLPLPSSSWAQLALMPSLMYRLEGLLRLQTFQQQLQQVLPLVMPPPGLLLTALTPKYAREDFNFERLEFIGDACLKYLAANYVLQSMPTATEGELSETKAKRVCNVHLASRADEFLCGSGEPLAAFLRLFPFDKATCTPTAMAQPLRKGGRKGKCKADFIEALIGAFYLAAAAQGNDSSMDVDGAASSQVSQAGLEAAAQLCETLGVLPLGSANTAATAPIWSQQQRPSPARLNKAQRLAAELRPVLGGYNFRRPALLQQALTHVSVLGAPSYQRLELLGDAVLDVLVSMQLLVTGSRTLGPGQLTVLRSGRVMNQELAKQATKAGLHKHVDAQARSLPWLKQLTGTIAAGAAAAQEQQQPQSNVQSAQQEAQQEAKTTAALMAAAETAAVRADDPIWKEVWEMDRGEEVDGEESMKQHKFKILADIVESVTAAVFVDSGGDWEATWAAMRGIVDMDGLAEGSAAEVRRMAEAQGPGSSVAELGDDEEAETADESGTESEEEEEEEEE